MFRKILIANRGEIALRVICACKELGIPTVAVYSEADRNSLHVRFADEAVCIGPPRSSESYLNIPHVISAAEITNVDAIHPGYGFLSENANFAEVCVASHITLIGPSPDLIRMMGEKDRARKEIAAAGLPVVPGSDGIVEDASAATKAAKRVGFPLIIKASAGGGGRGMRVVRKQSELLPAFEAARNEAQQAFGTPDVYLEKFIERPRHIEFQVLGDKHGKVIHLGERECSVQRRHQKLIEESPSPIMDEKTRNELGARVVAALTKIGYTNAGTVEFLRDEDGSFYFIEMNTRIQVEHPVTEMVTNVDLIKSQIRLAAGEHVGPAVGGIEFRGHSIECRINAEDPETFVPSAGRITTFNIPSGTGVRVDTSAYADSVISPYYDSLIAKLITRGRDRAEALARMRRALDMFIIEGVKTTIPLHRRIFANPEFQAGRFDTHFLESLGFDPAASGKMNRAFPRLYAVLSADLLPPTNRVRPQELAMILAKSGVGIIQYRDKHDSSRKLFDVSARITRSLAGHAARFILNDRPDIARLAGCDGVHVGQQDLPVDDARAVCNEAVSQRAGTSGKFWIGVSTHALQQVREAATTSADYIAIGPIFATTTKERPDDIVGTDFIRQARKLTSKPLVAIGGITLSSAAEIYEAGADCIAVARDLICAPDPAVRASEYLAIAGDFRG